MSSYNQVTPQIVSKLKKIVGQENVITNPAKLLPYSHDEMPGEKHRFMPAVVAKPATTAEVAALMKLACNNRIPVTPRGAGTGLAGGAVPVYGGIVLSLERMNRIVEIDRANLAVVAEPGVITNTINEMLAADGLFYPGYPMSKESCTIGGNVATNAGGGRAVKYGVTGRWVTGLEAVLPTGEIISLGGKRVKDVTGYNLVPLLVGSEGTLAVVTKVILRLLPLPAAQIDLMLLFPDIQPAIAMAAAITAEGKIIPAAAEFMDRFAVEISCRFLEESLPYSANALLLVQLDGTSQEEVFHSCEVLGGLAEKYGALEIYSAVEAPERKKIWRIREAVAEAVKAFYPVQSGEDMVVPVGAVAEFVSFLHALARSFGCEVVTYGHAGDGNVHARFLKTPGQELTAFEEMLPQLLSEAYRKAASLGGTISGEHGIGLKRKASTGEVLGKAEISLQLRLKRAFDPLNILNPGKIFQETGTP